MPLAAGATPYYVDALTSYTLHRWPLAAGGQPTVVTYSFRTIADSPSADDNNGFAPASAAQRTAVRQAFATWAAVANIHFAEMPDTPSVDIRVGTNRQGGQSAAYAYLPTTPLVAGDIYIANDYDANASPVSGNYAFLTLVHEIGHALGLKHPGNYNAGGGGSARPYLYGGDDQPVLTVMSYYSSPGLPKDVHPSNPSIYDIAAIQYLYGANRDAFPGDDVHAVVPGSFRTIWDPNGVNTLDASGQTKPTVIDLRPGTFSTIDGQQVLALASGTRAANARGGAGDDRIFDSTENGVIDGGGGTNTVVLPHALANYSVLRLGSGSAYVLSGPDGRDILVNVQQASFAGGAAIPLSSIVGGTFDALGYLASNPDLADALGASPEAAVAHYMGAGMREGRSFSAFDAVGYLAGNPDVLSVLGPNLEAAKTHWIQHGRREGRGVGAFDATQYMAANPDLLALYGADAAAATDHYLRYGSREGRPRAGFDAWGYLASNPDLIAALGADTAAAARHYVQSGFREKRGTSGFNALGYIAGNRDLIGAFGLDTGAAARHYVQIGRREGRATTGFDALRYVASNGDLAAAIGADATAATRHYITHGHAEGRATTAFDPRRYLRKYPELAGLLGNDPAAATLHYIATGRREGRTQGFNNAPKVTPGTGTTLAPYGSAPLSSLFGVSDPDGDTPTRIEVKVSGSSFTLGGAGTRDYLTGTTVLTTSDLPIARLTANTGSGSAQLSVRAFDGEVWSDWTAISVSAAAPTDNAGNSRAAARDLGALSATALTASDWVGSSDSDDYYSFTLAAPATVTVALSGLQNSAWLYLYGGATGTSLVTSAWAASGTATLSRSLTAGTYYLDVQGFSSAGTTYTLDVTRNAASAAAGMLAA